MFKLIWDFLGTPIPIGDGIYFKFQYLFYIGIIMLLFKFYMNFVKKV